MADWRLGTKGTPPLKHHHNNFVQDLILNRLFSLAYFFAFRYATQHIRTKRIYNSHQMREKI